MILKSVRARLQPCRTGANRKAASAAEVRLVGRQFTGDISTAGKKGASAPEVPAHEMPKKKVHRRAYFSLSAHSSTIPAMNKSTEFASTRRQAARVSSGTDNPVTILKRIVTLRSCRWQLRSACAPASYAPPTPRPNSILGLAKIRSASKSDNFYSTIKISRNRRISMKTNARCHF